MNWRERLLVMLFSVATVSAFACAFMTGYSMEQNQVDAARWWSVGMVASAIVSPVALLLCRVVRPGGADEGGG